MRDQTSSCGEASWALASSSKSWTTGLAYRVAMLFRGLWRLASSWRGSWSSTNRASILVGRVQRTSCSWTFRHTWSCLASSGLRSHLPSHPPTFLRKSCHSTTRIFLSRASCFLWSHPYTRFHVPKWLHPCQPVDRSWVHPWILHLKSSLSYRASTGQRRASFHFWIGRCRSFRHGLLVSHDHARDH